MEPYLLIDCHQLIWSSVHAIGSNLSHKGIPTYALYGFFNQILNIQRELQTKKIAFCFDYGSPIRKQVYPEYKEKRKTRSFTEEQMIVYKQVGNQISNLRDQHLHDIGFRNVFYQDGYEADDIIAMLCKRYGKKQKIIIVSNDHDMYQLLTTNVSIFKTNNRALFTKEHFIREFGIRPKDWVKVKAIAGCSSDEVAGIVGVGEKTAIRFIKNELNETSKKCASIACKKGRKIIERNLPLVRIPYPGTKKFKLREDKPLNWKPTLARLGIKSLTTDDFRYKER